MTHARKSKGLYVCGRCCTRGHNQRTCTLPDKRRKSKLFTSANEAYRENRALGLCDDCGRPSKRRARCKQCAARRNRYPSRQPAYRKANEYPRAK